MNLLLGFPGVETIVENMHYPTKPECIALGTILPVSAGFVVALRLMSKNKTYKTCQARLRRFSVDDYLICFGLV